VDGKGCLKGLLTVKDIQKARDFPTPPGMPRTLAGRGGGGVGSDLEERANS